MNRRLLPLLAVLATAVLGVPALAQTYPSQPVRVIVTAAPGGIIDIVARIAGEHLGKTLGQRDHAMWGALVKAAGVKME